MGLVHHHQVPCRVGHVGGLVPRELVRANDNRVALERAEVALLHSRVVGLGLKKTAGQEELLAQLLMPLLPEIGGRDHQNAALSFCPALGEHEAGFDGLAESHFVRQQRALGQGGAEGEQGRVHLMRVQVHLRTGHSSGELLHAVGGAPLGQLVGEVLGMVVRDRHVA